MENKFGKLMKDVVIDPAIKEGIKKFAKDTASDIGVKLIKDGANEISNTLSSSAKEASDEKKEFKEKYNKLRKILISTESNFKSYMEGIEEINNIIIYLDNEIATLKKFNPGFLMKKNSLALKQNKFRTLKTSLATDLTTKLSKECMKVFRTKDESSFFQSHPKINEELISAGTEEDVSKIQSEIYKKYDLIHSISTKSKRV